jgi:hypothetical protein
MGLLHYFQQHAAEIIIDFIGVILAVTIGAFLKSYMTTWAIAGFAARNPDGRFVIFIAPQTEPREAAPCHSPGWASAFSGSSDRTTETSR